MTSVCDTLQEECAPIWERLHDHPFVDEMGRGTLPERKFAFYIGQNIMFLKELARAMAIGVAKADDEATMRDFAAIVTNIVDFEIPKNRELLARVRDLYVTASEPVDMAPANLAYTRHLLTVAYSGRAADILASLAPCTVSYGLIGKERVAHLPDHPVYREWIEFFAGREYWEVLEDVKAKLDLLCEGLSAADMHRIEDTFRTSSRLELLFWDMAYEERTWAA